MAWLCFNDSFLSVVASDKDPKVLNVRARRVGDIEAVFGKTYPVVTLPARDYAFRAFIPRDVVANVVAAKLAATDYTNFKDSVADHHLHEAYARTWSTMAALQECPPYSTKPRPGFRAHPLRLPKA
ncbi:hypothetical protein [Paraburkholderia sp. BCC1876]|uniref:hypothetical protein n=1 Tax=Paraburkholderia sp. BCC1876 TaxID=2676303 RepID=UPI001590DF30|nr:hypothetical protein [Paraburkholderia sp. BCC1876]